VLAAVFFSVAMGFPTLRLKGPYFALAMLSGAAVTQNLTIIFSEYTGGQDGLNGLDPLLDQPIAQYYFTLACLALTALVLKLLANSPWGTILRAIRGDEASCGRHQRDVLQDRLADDLDSICGTRRGALRALSASGGPDLFAVILSINIIMMVYVGGMGSIYDPIGGAVLLNVLTEVLRGFSEYRLWVYTLVLIFIVFFMPQRLVAPLWRRIRAVTL
jgi:branched-chain amino acid transport system permease protein